ncbi:hypothetical protein D9M69_727000 [compost metagenome]
MILLSASSCLYGSCSGSIAPSRDTSPQTRRETARARSSRETNNVKFACFLPMSSICWRKTSTSTSGAASMTFLNFTGSSPLRIAIWRSASSASQLPMECARIETSFTSGSR